MARLPFIKWYPNDWLAEPSIRSCSLAARGLWIDVLSLMHLSPRRGYLLAATGLPLTNEQLARLTGCSTDEATRLLAELISSGACSCTDDGTIYSRRMVRDEAKRDLCSEAGRKGGGNPTFKGSRKGSRKGSHKGSHKPPEARGQKPKGDESPLTPSCPEPASPTSGQSAADPPTAKPSETPLASTETAAMSFPVVGIGLKEWSLSGAKFAEYQAAFPGLDILGQLRRARQWLLDNPSRRKTAGGMPRFLGSWLGRANDQRGSPGPATTRSGKVAGRTKAEQLDDYYADQVESVLESQIENKGGQRE